MILKSEGDKIKFCTSPLRDRKYVIAAYINLICEFPGSFIDTSLSTIICSLLELTQKSAGGFQLASHHESSAEEMLMDGAIDQTFAF
jgi:hypothetical protein